jgi:hypothetical protein
VPCPVCVLYYRARFLQPLALSLAHAKRGSHEAWLAGQLFSRLSLFILLYVFSACSHGAGFGRGPRARIALGPWGAQPHPGAMHAASGRWPSLLGACDSRLPRQPQLLYIILFCLLAQRNLGGDSHRQPAWMTDMVGAKQRVQASSLN